MSRECGACIHANRSELDSALARRAPLREISARFGISKSALHRHKVQHIAASVQALSESRALASASGLIDLVESLIQELHDLKTQARLDPKGGPEVRRNVEAILKAVGTMADLVGANAPRVNVNVQATAAPTPEEALSWSMEALLLIAAPAQQRQFAAELLARAGEDDHLLLEAPADFGVPTQSADASDREREP
jgi:hypothetical protein